MNIFRFKQDDISLNNENYRMIPIELLNHNFYMTRPGASKIAKLGGSVEYGGLMPYFPFLPAPFSTYKSLLKEYKKNSIPSPELTTETNHLSD
ncbi:hypothetical protein [Oceanirhabdus seepicola]|uniref:Uncharacterized protein n=1 Tax=Oceanirhabdus seepicola TaxID=2828781 RepID=A0A9J6P497_9CLOT|nr:hypothetical protein [Oceanirhabdus seepicola]MCM1990966.1 hypothetical protein [Oceanirhabdus seepicola]